MIDSVYEVSSKLIEEGEDCYDGKVQNGLFEELGYLHEHKKDIRKKLRRMDSYGFDKLEAETYLNHYCN